MWHRKTTGAILLMGGEGRRFGSDLPKQFHLLGGRKVYTYALETLIQSAFFDEILLVCHPDWIEEIRKEVSLPIVSGGKTRQESSFIGLKGFQQLPDIVLIHDAVRPFVSFEILKANLEGASEWGAVDTCIPTADTLVHAPDSKEIETIPRRAEYLRGQTPQTFRGDWILEAHIKAATQNASDDCQLVLQLGKPVHIVLGDEKNLKITSELDLLIAEQLLTFCAFSKRR